MEKSHHQAKAANQAHTAHGGGKERISVILQQFQHWYRNIQHRYNKKLECARVLNTPVDEARLAAACRRREQWHQSNAARALENWRSRRRRVGNAWVCHDSVGGGGRDDVQPSDSANEEDPEEAGNNVDPEEGSNSTDGEDAGNNVDSDDAANIRV